MKQPLDMKKLENKKSTKTSKPTNTEVVFNCRIEYSLKTNSALYQIDFQLRHLTSKLV